VTAPRPDEWARLTAWLPPLDAVIEVDAEVLAERLASLPDEVNALVRLLDGRRTLREVIVESGQGEIEAAAVLSRLHEQGVLRVGALSAARAAEGTPAPTPAPDGVEWFAAPEDVRLAEPPGGAGEIEPERHGPADLPADGPEPGGVGWVRAIVERLRR
jgi:hypothetical protein